VGVKQRPALQLARPVPGLVTDRRAVDNGREKRRKQRKIVVPFLLRGRDSIGFQHHLAKNNPMSWTLLPLDSSADYCNLHVISYLISNINIGVCMTADLSGRGCTVQRAVM